MEFIFGHDATIAEWVGKAIGKPFHPPFTAFGMVDGAGRLRGGFVFTGWTGDAVEMSLAGGGCLTRSAMAAVDRYVFGQLGCSRLEIHTRKGNKRARKMIPRAGFRFEGVARRLYGREDGLCYAITTDDLPALRARWRIAT